MAGYRELAETAWRDLPPLEPGQKRPDGGGSGVRSRLTRIMECLARQSGDLKAWVAVKEHDLSHAYAYLAIAELCKEAGEADRALEWAERGLLAFPRDVDPRLRSFLAREYQDRGRHAEAMTLLWANFTFDPCLEGYRQLKKQARQAGGWHGWRERVLEHLRALALRERLQRAGSRRPFRFEGDAASVLVEVLLWDKTAFRKRPSQVKRPDIRYRLPAEGASDSTTGARIGESKGR